jgi:glycosyltransferase involved in cell wall biosynthesis
VKILFHAEQLNYRGTTNSILEYAHYNQEILGNESVIVYSQENPEGLDVGSVPAVIDDVSKKFKLLTYNDNNHLNEIASGYDLFYSQRAGERVDSHTKRENAVITSTKMGVHCVFQWYDPHGDVYAYISEWMSHNVSKMYNAPVHPWVPYIVDLPEPDYDTRTALGIPKDKFVIGRFGGYKTFDLQFVRNVVIRVAQERDDIVFLFANTEPFCDLPNVIFLGPFLGNQQKSNYINACDAFIHARWLGESFGLAIAESLFFNRPVLACDVGFDRNHVETLKPFDLIYRENDEEDLYKKITTLRSKIGVNYRELAVEKYNPKNVMAKFKEVFIDEKVD